jgi:hypothetical protein
MTAAQVAEAFDQFLVKEGALVRVNDAAMDHGLIRAFQNRTYDVAKAVPTVVLRNDDYGRIERLVGRNPGRLFTVSGTPDDFRKSSAHVAIDAHLCSLVTGPTAEASRS